MAQEIISKLENRQTELEKEISLKEEELKEASRKVSQIQVDILELRGSLKETQKMLKSLKGEK